MFYLLKILFISCLFFQTIQAENLRIFVASNAKDAMIEVREQFIKQYPKAHIELVFGASGKAYQQFSQGLKYDLFFSADSKYPAQIVKDGQAASSPKVYALGIVALYALDQKWIEHGLDSIKANQQDIKHFSIANPKVAPYGVAAEEILKNAHLYKILEKKIVRGDNISQAISFIDSGAAEVGLVAYSLLSKKEKQNIVLIDPALYTRMEQSFVITHYAKDNPLAQQFSDFVLSPVAGKIFKKYGFNAPTQTP